MSENCLFKKIKSSIKGILIDAQKKRIGAPKTCRIIYKGIKCENVKFEDYVSINGEGCIINSEIGKASYLAGNFSISNTSIGKFSSIGPGLRIILGTHPTHDWVSTHPAFYSTQLQSNISFVEENIFKEINFADEERGFSVVIGNDVWVGANVSILDGVVIGDGAIIAAGAVVTKNVPDYAVVGGVPARIIRYRFDENKIKTLKEVKWWEKDDTWLKKHSKIFRDIDDFCKYVG